MSDENPNADISGKTFDELDLPREWWIDDLTQRVCAPWNDPALGIGTMKWPDSEKVIRVVEHSAYERMRKKFERNSIAVGEYYLKLAAMTKERDELQMAYNILGRTEDMLRKDLMKERDDLKKKLELSDENVLFYRREWESACERAAVFSI